MGLGSAQAAQKADGQQDAQHEKHNRNHSSTIQCMGGRVDDSFHDRQDTKGELGSQIA